MPRPPAGTEQCPPGLVPALRPAGSRRSRAPATAVPRPGRLSDGSLFVAACCVIPLIASGCATRGAARPLATGRNARDTVVAEVSDVVHTTRQQAARTWADMVRDWNYVDADSFSAYRDAGGN